ncbi:Ig-like domain-containing protein [Fibrobacter sp.]|uniref:Ig-like domain-containing protein n=1 Tax=Fibrobacter sp. TaxID=35828 RepID=UPI003870ABF2
MVKKMISWTGALCALAGSAYAASATVWTEGEGAGTKAPAYWYSFEYGTGAAADTSAWSTTSHLTALTAKEGKSSNGAGFGFTWEQNTSYKDVAVTLVSYKGVCLTYSATAPFRIDFKQSTITDDNYYGADLAAGTKKTFVAFANLKQGWKSTSTIAWNVTKQMGVQFSFKNTDATAAVNTNTIQITNFDLADECVTFAPTIQPPYTAEDEGVLDEGDTLKLNLAEVFTDPDGDIASYTVKIVGDKAGLVKLADTLYNKTGVVNLVTGTDPEGDAVVTITATDDTKKSVSYQLTLSTVNRENAPVAVDDTYETKEETALKTSLKNHVLLNDYDMDKDSYTATVVTEPAHGTLSFDGESGIFTYTPEENFYGNDFFTYVLTEDPRADQPDYEVMTSNEAKVTIKVTNVDDPIQVVVVDSTMTVEDTEYKLGDTLVLDEDFDPVMVKIPLENLVFSDPDVAGTDLEIKVKTSGLLTAEYGVMKTNHVVELASIADANGVSKVTLFAVDGKDTASVSFFVKIRPVADPPVAKEDTYKVVQDSVNKIAAAKGLLANDKNPDGKSTLKAYLYDEAVEGKVSVAEDGSFTYEIGHYEGEDTFMYYIVNAEGDTSEPVVVTLNVAYKNQPPKAVAGVADTIKRLSTLAEDFGSVTFLKKEMQTWFTDDSTSAAELTFTARSDDSLLAPTLITASGAIQVKSVKDACGETELIIVAKDKMGATGELAIPAKITCKNDRPVIAKAIDTLYAGLGETWNLKYEIGKNVTDPDGDTLTFKIEPIKKTDLFAWSLKDGVLSITSAKDSVVAPNAMYPIAITVSDAEFSGTFKLLVVAKEAPASIAPVVAAPKTNWQSAILANRGSVAIFDMQGRVMWKAKLPVSEADVRNAAAQVQGRKILQVNKQRWTIK